MKNSYRQKQLNLEPEYNEQFVLPFESAYKKCLREE